MRRVFLFVIASIVVLMSHPVRADETPPPDSRWALEYSMGPNLTLVGSAISIRRISGPNSLRVSVGGAYQSSYYGTYLDNTWNASIAALFIHSTPIRDRVNFYAGIGPWGGYEKGSGMQIAYGTGWTVALAGAAGAEWRVRDRIGVHAEYHPVLTYSSGRSEDDGYSYKDEFTSATLRSFVAFGLAVYF